MAKPLLTYDVCGRSMPLLPPVKRNPKGVLPRVPDRLAMTGVLFVAKTGAAWELLAPELGCGSGMTCWRRLRDWQVAGVWQKVWKALLDELGLADKIDWSKAVVDSSSVRALFRGAQNGPNPTDRGKNGSKRHVISDDQGVLLALIHTGANVHDSQAAMPLVDSVPSIKRTVGGRRRRPDSLNADRA